MEMSDFGGRPGPLEELGGRPGPLFLTSVAGVTAFFGGLPRLRGGDDEAEPPSSFRFFSAESFGGRPRFDGAGLWDEDLGGRPLFLWTLDSVELADFGGRPRLRGEGVVGESLALGERPRFPFPADVDESDFDDLLSRLLGEERSELATLPSLFRTLDGRPLAKADVVARRVDTFREEGLLQLGQSQIFVSSGISFSPTQNE
jgi:hypothetical protein